ncbi:GyrI-like domain-containing protein [Paenibacillus agri]|uniref:GyrI-like domain-containing protein n=1 Tax=Paenibacillus agri TaxID=2744309 RepID=A0A850EMU8_9BACL|nr:GyrI-like domain-containing protein [Paenibacillus agri]NUU62623.1 GyrI-like domain-containing protein [Paenibacillus agri]
MDLHEKVKGAVLFVSIKSVQIQRNETKLVGYAATASLNQDLENEVVVKLREALIARSHEIANQLDDTGIYLVQVYPDVEWTPDVPFESIVAVAVSEFSTLNDGFISHTLPAGTYAKITHTGPESQIGETYDAIREADIAGDRMFDFEYWADMGSPEQEESVIEIYLPLGD